MPNTKEEIRDIVRDIAMKVPVNNRMNGLNCQNWVGEALQQFVDLELITASEKTTSLARWSVSYLTLSMISPSWVRLYAN
ncbi:hypothetical protein ACJ73_00016 [Blastomyces percursus]|uniref:Uncharacterized protein n=1 Tax=Blastomyces percursus TaxID=1658174 RepID=A0A1J9RJ67_9EURO|nr:hypothetical protein ACJ73_00016 [Blastomyces percursus]